MASDVQKLVVFVAASVLFLGILYLFTSEPSVTGAGVTETGSSSFSSSLSSSPLVIFIVLGIVIYTLLTIMRKRGQ